MSASAGLVCENGSFHHCSSGTCPWPRAQRGEMKAQRRSGGCANAGNAWRHNTQFATVQVSQNNFQHNLLVNETGTGVLVDAEPSAPYPCLAARRELSQKLLHSSPAAPDGKHKWSRPRGTVRRSTAACGGYPILLSCAAPSLATAPSCTPTRLANVAVTTVTVWWPRARLHGLAGRLADSRQPVRES